MAVEHASEEKKGKVKRQVPTSDLDEGKQKARPGHEPSDAASAVSALQNMVGNRAVQRLLAQRSGDEPFDLDDETESRINSQRGGGQSLDEGVRENLEGSMGHDMSGVRVHTSPESDALNKQLGAKAFTTGSDIFFGEGQYDPHSSSGQELIAHEATHVVQQSTGKVDGGSGMTVNAPGDEFEQEADDIASQVMRSPQEPSAQPGLIQEEMGIQLQEEPEEEEEEAVQTQEEEEEIMMQEVPEEEEALQMQEVPEEEEALQMQEEEEEVMMQEVPEEEEALQMQEEEEELIMPKRNR
jgi:hypothetical protein